MDVLISGVPDSLRAPLTAAVSETLAGHAHHDGLSVVLTKLRSGEWTVFVADRANIELVDPELTARIVRTIRDTEQGLREGVRAEDRRLLEVIARAHGHGPRRSLALLDIAWAETGSQDGGREALQRLLVLGLIELQAGCDTPNDCLGWLSDKGARLVGYS
jgi:hypothetical protein